MPRPVSVLFEGRSIREWAADLGVCYQTAWQRLRKRGSLRTKRLSREDRATRDAKIVRERSEGWRLKLVAKWNGVTVTRVQQILAAHKGD